MKPYKIVLVFAVGLLSLTSCEDELELVPITDKVATNFFSNEAEIESAIAGVYSQLQSNSLFGLDLIGAGEISGEDSFEEIAANDGGRFGQLDDFSTIPGNDLVGDIWREGYEGIQRANVVLNRIGEVEFASESTRNQRIGEMKFARAIIYYYMVRLYGDVPLVIEETENPSDFFGQGRTPAAQVYDQIVTDLSEAAEQLPVTKVSGRPAQGAALALLADVYMTQGDFNSALTLYQEIVQSGVYELMPTTSEIFGVANEGNAEILFEIQYASGLNGNAEGSSAASQFRPSGTTANAKGHNLPTQAFVDSYEAGDSRATDYVGKGPGSEFNFSLKYEVSPTGADDGGSDHIIIRYADVLLKYAEAMNEVGQTTNAITVLNSVRSRAGLAATAATSQAEVRAAIRQERRWEFIGEGHRWFDLKRYGNAVEVMTAFFNSTGSNASLDNSKLILPIPQSQVDTDPEFITQNPGY